MPDGAITFSTPALVEVTNNAWNGLFPVAATSLAVGTNVLAVEVHQSATGTNDLLFGAELLASPAPAPKRSLVFNEIAASTNQVFWIELANNGTNEASLDGYVVAHAGALYNQFAFQPGQ